MWLDSNTFVAYLGSSCLPEAGGLPHCPKGRGPPGEAKSSSSRRARVSAQDRLRMADVSLKPPAASIPTNLSSRASCCRGSARVRPEGSEQRQGLSALSAMPAFSSPLCLPQARSPDRTRVTDLLPAVASSSSSSHQRTWRELPSVNEPFCPGWPPAGTCGSLQLNADQF